ncbi:hypothetical protein [Streptomyces sp. NPDC048565]|uniref:hypothetical protein n=1 Tax=Streptomyces sp. NPDC048565 TaxID=3155266 RepID=UPI003444A2D4
MQNVRHTIATATITAVLVGLCTVAGAGAASAAQAGNEPGLSAVTGGQAGNGTDDESWH